MTQKIKHSLNFKTKHFLFKRNNEEELCQKTAEKDQFLVLNDV